MTRDGIEGKNVRNASWSIRYSPYSGRTWSRNNGVTATSMSVGSRCVGVDMRTHITQVQRPGHLPSVPCAPHGVPPCRWADCPAVALLERGLPHASHAVKTALFIRVHISHVHREDAMVRGDLDPSTHTHTHTHTPVLSRGDCTARTCLAWPFPCVSCGLSSHDTIAHKKCLPSERGRATQ